MKMVDSFRIMGVRTNADTPEDARMALNFRLKVLACSYCSHVLRPELEAPLGRETPENDYQITWRKKLALELAPYVKNAAKETLRVMDGAAADIPSAGSAASRICTPDGR